METTTVTKDGFEARTQKAYDTSWKLITWLCSIGAILGIVTFITLLIMDGSKQQNFGKTCLIGFALMILGLAIGFIASVIAGDIIACVKYQVFLTPPSFTGPRAYDLADGSD